MRRIGARARNLCTRRTLRTGDLRTRYLRTRRL